MAAKEKLLAWLNSQVGYREGCNNENKYAQMAVRAIGWNAQNQPWCAVFVAAAFTQCFGVELGCHMLRGSVGGIAALCVTNADRFKYSGAFYMVPEVGDVVYFYVGNGINHEGIVVKVTDSTIETIEGNSGDSVKRNTYKIKDISIAGYGRPAWPEEDKETAEDDHAEEEQKCRERGFIRLQEGDGMNCPLPTVKAWQNHLVAWGFDLDADGEFGPLTRACTEAWQELAVDEYGADVEVNGIVDEDDWTEVIKVPS